MMGIRIRGLRGRRTGLPAVAVAALCAIGGGAPANAQDAPPPDLTILCDSALTYAMTDVAHLWQRQTGVAVHVIPSPTPLLLKQITHPIRSDFAIAQGDPAEAAGAEQAAIRPGTIFGGWRNRLVVAERATPAYRTDPPAPPASPPGLATLILSGSIAIVDAPVASAGADTEKALRAAALWDAAQKSSIGVVGTADAAYLLKTGKVRFAVVLATDVASDPALSVADKLPDDSYAPITYWVAQTKVVRSPNADKFAEFLHQPGTEQRLRSDGLEVRP